MERVYLHTPARTGRFLAALAVLVWSLLPAPAGAGSLYRYIDDRGVVHYTNISYDRRYHRVRPPSGFGWSAVSRKDGQRFDPLIRDAAAAAGVPPAIVKAVIHAESAFDMRAVSRAVRPISPSYSQLRGGSSFVRPDGSAFGIRRKRASRGESVKWMTPSLPMKL